VWRRVENDAAPHPVEKEEQLLRTRVRKNLAIGLVITTVMTALSVVVADDGSRVEELRESLKVGLSVTGAVTGATWLLQRRRAAQ
jgi:hypothetical protein